MQKKRISGLHKKSPQTEIGSVSTTRNWKLIKETPERLYKAFTNPDELAVWLAPGNMTGKIHNFDLRVGGGYEMSLYYPVTEKKSRGKTNAKEDRFAARFIELSPPLKIVQAIIFESNDPSFLREMIMEVIFEKKDARTRVTVVFKNIPPGIRPEDNKAGTRSSLRKLAQHIENN